MGTSMGSGFGTSRTTSRGGNLETRETERLIAGDKVEGTSVVRPNGDTIGEIERLMIDKRTGKVAYAVMSFGGILGIGESRYPLPWNMLTYNEALDGYEVDITEERLRDAPSYSGDDDEFDWSNREWGTKVHDHYDARPYWA